MKTIGVLGGLGPQATMDFEARVHAVSQRLIPQRASLGYPPMVVWYCRHAPILVNDDLTPLLPMQPNPRLFEAARWLGAVADFLVITSNGVHLLQEAIEQAAGRPVLSMVDATVAEVQRRGLGRVGVLGLGEPRVYFEPLARAGVTYETISGELRDRLDQAIWAVDEGRADEVQEVAREAVATLNARRVEAVILGCTEIPLMLPEAETSSYLINPTALLAEAAVRHAMEWEL